MPFTSDTQQIKFNCDSLPVLLGLSALNSQFIVKEIGES